MDSHKTLHSWGIALSNWARIKEGPEAGALFAQAGEKFQGALAIKPDYESALFNMACLAGLRGDADGVVSALEKWKVVNSKANKAKLDGDTDFDRVRNDPRFQSLRDSLPG